MPEWMGFRRRQCQMCRVRCGDQNLTHLNFNITCNFCPTGKFIVDNSTVDTEHISCNFCPLGREYINRTTFCSICHAGQFQNSSDTPSATCKYCASGQFLLDQATNFDEGLPRFLQPRRVVHQQPSTFYFHGHVGVLHLSGGGVEGGENNTAQYIIQPGKN